MTRMHPRGVELVRGNGICDGDRLGLTDQFNPLEA
jgi:hypothetical protein